MFRRLFSATHEFDKVFEQCKVDSSHELVRLKKVVQMAQRYLNDNAQRQNIHININIENNVNNNINININPGLTEKEREKKLKKKRQFVQYFIKKMHTKDMVLTIKTLVVGHAIVRRIQDAEFKEEFMQELERILVESKMKEGDSDLGRRDKEKVEIKVESTKQDFMQRNVVAFYCYYLKKFILNFDTYLFAKSFDAKKTQSIDSQDVIAVINRGFVVLNLVNYILHSQQTFNKMGRYYLPHKELLALFIKYLEDLIVYNAFIKRVTALSVRNVKGAGSEEVKHHFLFVTEAQKTSDRLYEFFYNRYYYNEVKSLVMMPTFLTIHAEEYKELVDEVKRKDRELVMLVKKSKYEHGGRSYSCAAKTTRTDDDELEHHRTEANSLSLSTSMYSSEEGSTLNEIKKCQIIERKRCKTVYKQ